MGQRVSLEETSKIKHLKKVADYERKSPESSDSGDFWWRLLDSNQWPHACEDSIGTSSDGFRENKAGLPRDFLTRRCSLFRCFRPGFSVRGSRRGSMSISMTFAQLLVVLLLRDLALTASVAYGKIFLDSKQLW